MEKITSVIELKNAISILEKKKKEESVLLKKEIHLVFESLKPANFIKKTWKDLTTSPEIGGNVVDNILGHVIGFLSKKVLIGTSRNPFKKIVGSIFQMGVTNVATKNSQGIKSIGLDLLKKIFNKRENHNSETRE